MTTRVAITHTTSCNAMWEGGSVTTRVAITHKTAGNAMWEGTLTTRVATTQNQGLLLLDGFLWEGGGDNTGGDHPQPRPAATYLLPATRTL